MRPSTQDFLQGTLDLLILRTLVQGPLHGWGVSLRIQEDLSYAEIGEIVGCSEAAARVNYHYGVQRLREVLGDDDDAM